MKKTNAVSHGYTGTASPVQIMTEDTQRTYICFFAVSGDCDVVIGDNDFDANAITIPEGKMWEPTRNFISSIWFRGTGSKLSVIW